MKTEVTVQIEIDLLHQLETMAVEERMTTTAFVTHKLQQLVQERQERLEQLARKADEYAAARERALIRLRDAVSRGWQRPGSRDELHER